MAKKLKSDYIEEAIEMGAVVEDDPVVVEERHTVKELRTMIQRHKKLNGHYHDIDTLTEKFHEYIDNHTIPIVKEFCLEVGINSDVFYKLCSRNDKLVQAKKRCVDKKETNLERGSLAGKINRSMAIFSLKQLGWTDERKVEHDAGENLADFFKNSMKDEGASE